MSRINLSDTTFILPYYMDSPERYENLCAVYNFLRFRFTTKILIVRYAGSSSKIPSSADSLHIAGWNGVFHRTKAINEGIKFVKTPYVGIYDVDCIFNPSAIASAVQALRDGATLAYPFAGKFVDIDRDYIKEGCIIEHHSYAVNSYGGACFLNRAEYIECGMENENLGDAWCHDDVERYERVNKLGYKIKRVADGVCYHIVHPRSEASKSNPSDEEYMKVKGMSKDELLNYIKSWSWLQK